MTSNWKKKITRPTALFRQNRPRSTPVLSTLASAPPTPAAEAVRRYDDEAEQCLRTLEFEAGLLNCNNSYDRKSVSSPLDDLMRTSTTTTTTTTSINRIGSPDLLGTFCRLMHYVVHLRKENRHLRKQVLCLHEMREIEKLQNQLLKSACACETGVAARNVLEDHKKPNPNRVVGGGKNKKHWRYSMPATDFEMDVDEKIEPTKSPLKNNSTSLATISAKPDATPAVTKEIRIGGVGGEKIEKRSFSGAAPRAGAAGGHKPSAPVTATSGGGGGGAQTKIGQQSTSHVSKNSRRYLAPPTKEKPLSSSGSSREGAPTKIGSDDIVGKADRRRSSSNLLNRGFLSPTIWSSVGRSSNGCNSNSNNSGYSAIRHGAEEALAEANDDKAFLLMHSSLDSASYSPRSMSSGGSSSLTKSFHGPISSDARETSFRLYGFSTTPDSDDVNALKATVFLGGGGGGHYSDSDQDQSVFTEVQLPDYRRSSNLPIIDSSCQSKSIAKKNSGSPRVWRYSDLSCVSTGSGNGAAAALSLPDNDAPTAQTRSGGILGRLGLKRPSVLSKRRAVKTVSMGGDEFGQQVKTNLIAPLISKSMYDEKIGDNDQNNRDTSFVEAPPADRWKLARKAFLKKRKRKISESDSLASSDASGKSYMTIELPDINYCRKTSYPPSVPIITTVDVDGLSQSVTKEYAQKMRQWQEEKESLQQRPPAAPSKTTPTTKKDKDKDKDKENEGSVGGGIIRRMSQKGQQIKRGWLRKPKNENETSTSTSRYFEKEDGRQNTVVENDVKSKQDNKNFSKKPSIGWSASDTDICRKMTSQEIGPILGGPSNETSKHQRQQQHRRHPPTTSQDVRRQESKLRSVTFLEQLSPSETTTISLTTSQQLTISNDSVFTSLDADSHCWRSNANANANAAAVVRRTTTTTAASRRMQRREEEQQQEQQTADVVEQLLVLQERNSSLIRNLKDKTKEYERITDRLGDLEKEVQALRERHRFDANLEQLYNAVLEPNFVPVTFVQEIEKQVEDLDHNIRLVKSEAYETQQLALETHANDQATTMRYLTQIDSLQKANFHLLSKTLSELNRDEHPEIRRQLELLPTYEALYSFTINLLRKLKHIRTRLLEKNFSVSKLDLELLQTQSSLLLAHAQIERQKMEMRLMKSKNDVSNSNDFGCDRKLSSLQAVRRTHSFHGQDILARAVNSELSFYLPFKLHGFHTMKRDHRQSNVSLYHGDETLELEFAKLFDTVNRLSGHYDEIQLPLQTNDDQHRRHRKYEENQNGGQKKTNDEKSSHPPNDISSVELRLRWRHRGSRKRNDSDSLSTTPMRNQHRPISCNVPIKETEVKRIADEIAAGRYFTSNNAGSTQTIENVGKAPPNYLKKAPPPLKLGNVGQVKAMAAAFDTSLDNENNSAPNTPVAKTAPSQLLQRRVQEKETKTISMKPASHRRDFDRPSAEESKISKIPVRANTNQQTSTKSNLRRAKIESPYETLTFLCRETDLASPPPPSTISRLSPSTSCSVNVMEKSTSPDLDTAASSTASSTWSIGKRNEVKKMQFFCSYSSPQRQQRCPELPTSPVPPSSPTPKTPPTPIPPTPTPPTCSSRFPEFAHSSRSILADNNFETRKKNAINKDSSIPVSAEKNSKKPSWFQKLRHKN